MTQSPNCVKLAGAGVLTSIVLLVVGALVGVVVTIIFQGMLSRPKLRVAGSGSGIGPVSGFRTCSLTIENEPGFLNLRLGQTTIFGKRIHRPHTLLSLLFERMPAHQCTAVLSEKGMQQGVGLYWTSPSGGAANNNITIEPGQQVSLRVFARVDADPVHYFAYQPADASGTPRVPPSHAQFAGARSFNLTIHYSYGRQGMNLEVGMQVDPNGNLQFRHPNGGGSF